MKKILILFCTVLFSVPFQTKAQKLAFEKTYEITGKAKRGYLDEVKYDAATQNTTLSFVTSATGNFTGSNTKVKTRI